MENLKNIFQIYDIILFTMNGCKACDMFKPIFLKVVDNKYRYCILNVDNSKDARDLAILLEIQGFPATVIIKNNNLKIFVGCFTEKKFFELIETNLK